MKYTMIVPKHTYWIIKYTVIVITMTVEYGGCCSTCDSYNNDYGVRWLLQYLLVTGELCLQSHAKQLHKHLPNIFNALRSHTRGYHASHWLSSIMRVAITHLIGSHQSCAWLSLISTSSHHFMKISLFSSHFVVLSSQVKST